MGKDAILGLIRHILTFGGGFAVAKGWVDGPGLETVVGAIVSIAGVIWSAVDKKQRASE